jgi:stalled ribosome rescue protein Dom34
MSNYLAVWIDHKEARIFRLEREGIEEATITAPLKSTHHKHSKGSGEAKEHPDDAKRFFHDVAQSLEGSGKVLIVGPSSAKLEFSRYLHKHDPAIEARIVGIETVDHPSSGQIVAYAKEYFQWSDRSR